MKDCMENSCKKQHPELKGSTARTVFWSLTLLECNKSVLIFGAQQDISTVWKLRCAKDKDSYRWLKFSSDAKR